MRNALLIALLGLAAVGLALLVLDGGSTDPAASDVDDLGPGDSTERELPDPNVKVRRDPLTVVVPKGKWNVVTELDERPQLDADPRFGRREYIHDPTNKVWYPTGAQVLEILEREAARDLTIKFESQADLDAFTNAKWTLEIPGVAPLYIYLESAVGVGYMPVKRADAIYMRKMTDEERGLER